MKENIKKIISENINGYTLDRIILFGSRARGDFDDKSDYDVYVALKEKLNQSQKIGLMDELLEKLAKAGICADIIIGNLESLKENNISGNVSKYVIEEGIEL